MFYNKVVLKDLLNSSVVESNFQKSGMRRLSK